MQFHELPGIRQPQSRGGFAACGPRGKARESAEKPLFIIFRESRPPVGDFDPGMVAFAIEGDGDGFASWRELDGVADQVVHRLLDSTAINFGQTTLLGRKMKLLVLAFGQGAVALDHFGHTTRQDEMRLV